MSLILRASSLVACAPSRVHNQQRHATTVYAFKKGEKSGIHDPAGPTGSWGTGEGIARKERKAQEENFVRQEHNLAQTDTRAEVRKGEHPPGHSSVNRPEVVSHQLQEMADEAADEEYSHMGRLQKWFMELKAMLYEWTRGGVEPL